MSPISSISSISTNLIAASAAFGSVAANTANVANTQGPLAAAIVEQDQAGVQLQAAANVAKIADEMTATILDITA
jgi:hypothetical protein